MSLVPQISGMFRLGNQRDEDVHGFEALLAETLGKPIYRDRRLVLFCCERDCWPGACLELTSNSITAIVGEPLLQHSGMVISRSNALSVFTSSLKKGSYSCLREAHGTYSGISYFRDTETLYLFSDKIGVRGMCFAQINDFVIFSTVPSVVFRLVETHSPRDQAGITETLAFGYPLGDRTHLVAVKRMLEAEVVRCSPAKLVREQYHKWQAQIDYDTTLSEAANDIGRIFDNVVRERLSVIPQKLQVSFLSGGMDSRLLVKTLRMLGHTPITLNVAPEETLDSIFGELASAYFKTRHYSFPASKALSPSMDEGVRQVAAIHPDASTNLCWSGDGGSVGLGYVYLSSAHCPRLPTSIDKIAMALIKHNKWNISQRALKRSWRHLCDFPLAGLVEELERFNHLPPEKRAYAFLLFNDQRRHLDPHFSSLGGRKHDLLLPFFDDRLIQATLDIPSEFLLYHKLYNVLFRETFPTSHNIPWQAYPGHEPCPHPHSVTGRYQWSSETWSGPDSLLKAKRTAAVDAMTAILGRKFAAPINVTSVAIAAALTFTGRKDMRHVLRTASELSKMMN